MLPSMKHCFNHTTPAILIDLLIDWLIAIMIDWLKIQASAPGNYMHTQTCPYEIICFKDRMRKGDFYVTNLSLFNFHLLKMYGRC